MSSHEKIGSRALRKGRLSIFGQIYHVTARSKDGAERFADFSAARAACPAFVSAAAQSNIALLAWVLMPDHAHWLIELGDGANLSKAIAAMKRSSASAINALDASNRGRSVWQDGFYDRAVRSDEDIAAVARYVVANPLRAKLVDRIGDYPFWNSVWL